MTTAAAASRRPIPTLRMSLATAALLLAAFGLRLLVMERAFPVTPLGDELYYVLVASRLADGEGHVYGRNAVALRPPAQAWVLSHFADSDAMIAAAPGGRQSILPSGLRPLLRVEVALGTALVLATVWLGAALFDRRTGLLAGAIAAAYPTFIAYSHLLWSETLFAALVTAALAALVSARGRRSNALALLAGGLFGAAALTREIALPVACAGTLWTWLAAAPVERRAAASRAALVLGAAVLVVLPWAARNHRELGRVLPISSVGWIAIGEGNHLEGATWLHPGPPGRAAFRRQVNAVEGEVERSDLARRLTLERIADDQPGWLFRKLAQNVPLMLSPDAFHLYKLRAGSYGDVAPAARIAVTALTALCFVVVAGFAAFGVSAARGGNRRLLALLVLGVVFSVHVASNANSRFRMPWMPLLITYAAHMLLGGRALLAATGPRARAAALLAAVFVAAVSASYYLV